MTFGRGVTYVRCKQRHLRRAIDQDGHVLDALMQSRRNTRAAQRIFCKLLRDLQCVARVIVTDKLRSYGAANAPSCRTSSTGKAST